MPLRFVDGVPNFKAQALEEPSVFTNGLEII